MYNIHHSQIRTLRPGDRNFQIVDGLTTASRAGFEISNECPYNHLQVLQTCIDRGWVKPVAYLTERELIFMGLSND